MKEKKQASIHVMTTHSATTFSCYKNGL